MFVLFVSYSKTTPASTPDPKCNSSQYVLSVFVQKSTDIQLFYSEKRPTTVKVRALRCMYIYIYILV